MAADLLTAAQIGQMLDLDTSTVYRMAGDGRLPAVRVGRQWRFPADRVAQSLQVGIPATASAAGPLPTTPAEPAMRDRTGHAVGAVVDVAAEALGVMMVVTDMQGRPLRPVANPCRWFVEHGDDDEVVAECVDEWRELASELDLVPRFRLGRHGFLCARAFVRSGTELVGMVLAGGVAPDGAGSDAGLHHLDPPRRDHVLQMLPRIAASLSHLMQKDLR